MRLDLQRFMSHEHSIVELPERGVVLVTGRNGSGKSALVEAVAQAMWGKTLRGARWSPWRGGLSGLVQLKDGGLLVTRSWDGEKKALRWSSGDEYDTTTKAQEGLASIVGPFEVWRRTCVFSSSDAAHFTLASDVERKQLLEQLLGLGWFDAAHRACLADLKHAHSASGAAQRECDLAATRAQALTEGLRKLEQQLEQEGPAPDVGSMRLDEQRYRSHERDAASEARELSGRIDEMLRKVADAKARDRVAGERLTLLTSKELCPTCEQPIPRALVDRLGGELAATAAVLATAEAESQRAWATLKAESDELLGEARKLGGLASETRVKIAAVEDAQRRRELLDKNLKATGQEIRKSAEKLAELMARRQAIRVDVAELEACERVLNARGVRAQVVGGTLAAISARANSWLSQLGSELSLELLPYTERKSGSVVDAISLTLSGAGGEAGYPGASAGERRRVDVALLLSLAELASAASVGATWRSPVFFDEVFDSLDGDGREAVAELVADVGRQRCVVVVTHDESLASIRADVRLRVDAGVVT